MRRSNSHEYRARLVWEGNHGTGTADHTGYGRRHRIAVDGKPDLLVTADPAFRGDPGLHNPEELLVAAVASCHMLTYLALCARRGIAVVDYADTAHGTLELEPGGGGRFGGITLRPRVAVSRQTDLEAARALHDRAHEMCFIARSCGFPIHHRPEVSHR